MARAKDYEKRSEVMKRKAPSLPMPDVGGPRAKLAIPKGLTKPAPLPDPSKIKLGPKAKKIKKKIDFYMSRKAI